MSIDEVVSSTRGRPLVQPPRRRDSSTSSAGRERTPSVQYRESLRRQAEREEAQKIRRAMEELDLNDEGRIYDAARDEAAELVWKHRHPNDPSNNPHAPYAYPGLSKKADDQRSRSLGRDEQHSKRSESQTRLRKRSSMGSSVGSRSSSLQSRRTPSGSSITANAGFNASPVKSTFDTSVKVEEDVAPLPKPSSNPSAIHQRRRSSSGRRRASGSLFKNPNDQIYEEPEEEAKASGSAIAPTPVPAATQAAPEPPKVSKLPFQARRNPFSRVQLAKTNSVLRSSTDPTAGIKKPFGRHDFHHDTPTQSRNPEYTSNTSVPVKPKAEESTNTGSDTENEPDIKMRDGKEIRSEELRAATSFRLKDRSPKLPTPTLVSDKPGRPIVSFHKDLRPNEIELKEERFLPDLRDKAAGQEPEGPRGPVKAVTVPIVPTINLPDEGPASIRGPTAATVPTISVSSGLERPSGRVTQPTLPAINLPENGPARPLPTPGMSRKVATPKPAAALIPTISVSQTPPARSPPSPMPPIPTISVQETPSISVRAPSASPRVTAPSISVTPSIPSIAVSETPTPNRRANAPAISVDPPVPHINVNGPGFSTRPLPTPKPSSGRAIAKPFSRPDARGSQSHWTPTTVRSGALCAHCALPISGRIVSAAGCRFHPECFRCHHCGEHLECVAFYPEPENKYAERVARIHARMRGEDLEFLPSHPTHEDMMRLEEEDGDEAMRFFCHLDFHELFSPRCKSCKTPIEGEVVVACGAEWHVGHFFCAQCGDPFDSTTPFVEKDGYAWCVGCHTNRFSTKCKKCRKPVTDTVVKALGAEWHADCFCCMECSGPFDDGRYFLRGDSQDPVCVKCEERRLKA
ncbi:hypothetical protein M011DRAFT_467783 [Sporormia fimetaria CBS 119925]|uniref:LIM zinc-binding domain-containing protein n=1 Tax=Sporormia fimetaria CBS 119925 TaxID=1340428 RepID=A0A6A6VCF0_9PLEO|nr:hypothetical protein M011DRAFT_467783 [Sporormia fimetaria CBS 119925]